ncbi:YdbH domain-containing protein [Hahella sp. NBU794]|uniref:YdbH domain-containing protein n=1 Tax=Hahella sp. NBU794 TaxID=3422590 RepID=UPI003D6EB0C7
MTWRKRLAWGGLITLLTLCILTGVAWWFAPQWLPPLAQELAGRAGVDIRKLEIGRPGWGGWRLREVELGLDGGAIVYGENVKIGWRCCQKIEESLTAKAQRIVYTPVEKSTAESSAPVAVSALLYSVAQRIPFITVEVEQLETPAGDQTLTASLSLERTLEGLDLQAQTQYQDAPLAVSLNWVAPTSLSLSLASDQRMTLSAEGELGDDGVWRFSGEHSADWAASLAAIRMPQESITSLHTSGVLQLMFPDVIGSAPWSFSIKPKFQTQLAQQDIKISGETNIELNGVTAPETAVIQPSTVLVNVPQWPESAPSLPLSWQVSVLEAVRCEHLSAEPSCPGALKLELHSKPASDTEPQLNAKASLQYAAATKTVAAVLQTDATLTDPKYPQKVELALDGQVKLGTDIQVNLKKGARIAWSGWSLQDASMELKDGNIELGKTALSINTGASKTQPGQGKPAFSWSLTTDAKAKVSLSHKGQNAEVNLAGRVKADDKRIALDKGQLSALGLSSPIEVIYRTAENKGWLSYDVEGKLANFNFIKSYIAAFPEALTINLGKVSASGALNWSMKDALAIDGRSNVTLSNWGATYEEIKAKGVSLTSDVQFTGQAASFTQPLRLTVASVEAADMLQTSDAAAEVSGRVEYAKGLTCDLQLDRASIGLFDGKARLVQPAKVQCPLTHSDFWVEVSNLDLGKLVALESDKIKASGRIAGLLPITIKDGGVIANNGRIAAQSSGSINLVDVDYWRALSAANPSLQFAVDALENFNYNSLVSRVDYQQNGVLLFDIELAGRSANKRYSGAPIALNVNLQTNIIDNLRSILVPGSIQKKLEKGTY